MCYTADCPLWGWSSPLSSLSPRSCNTAFILPAHDEHKSSAFEGFWNCTWKPIYENLCWVPDPFCYLKVLFPQRSSSAGSLGLQLCCLEVHNIWHKLIQGLQRLQKTCQCYTQYNKLHGYSGDEIKSSFSDLPQFFSQSYPLHFEKSQ